MSKRLIFVLVMVAVFLGATSGLVFAQVPDNVQNCASDQILVKFLPGIPEETKAQAHKRNGNNSGDTILNSSVAEMNSVRLTVRIGGG